MADYLRPTPWDKRNFQMDTFEVMSLEEEALAQTENIEGHFTIKVDPSKSSKILLDHGFYYVDTLIEPVCEEGKLTVFEKDGTGISLDYDRERILEIAEESFENGRFHRDFNIPDEQADLRYMNWVSDLMDKNQIYALFYEGNLIGFYGFEKENVLLLGMKKEYRSKGLAKPLTSMGCKKQWEDLDLQQLKTSISAANAPSLNLFYSLGFRLRSAKDVYHKINRSSMGV
ncbi:GNAT family N-acetyltransferase [Halobacillus sp. A1]|uniref:GNAT family N-acetyltransferase n=1 Tax=Halobacillus sp. A1 TaxID=2880262 RepID=UPI0020A69E6A|nr:GNAT family N-acetyltransferase [Halobacillus sp. A1]